MALPFLLSLNAFALFRLLLLLLFFYPIASGKSNIFPPIARKNRTPPLSLRVSWALFSYVSKTFYRVIVLCAFEKRWSMMAGRGWIASRI
jgi:hypothetical protein